ncbi:MAG: hypothetical protein PHD01_02955 [Geobacteraceae bacterium]|nr:hypothetical protein [Geobacteraceae bacterium]
MGRCSSLLILLLIVLAGCAGNRNAVSSPAEYVEIDNPAFTMSPGAPPTIWVPRSYVESGVPRGGELLEKGYESVRSNLAGSGEQAPTPQRTATVSPLPIQQQSVPVPVVKSRILVVEVGKKAALPAFSEALKKVSAGIVVDPAQASVIARYAAVGSQSERSLLAVKLQEDFGVNLVLYLAAPEGILPGKPLSIEVFEAHGGSLVKRFDATVPANAASETAAISSVMQKLALDVRETAALVPWYGKVVSVDTSRVYINAGKESGLTIGRVLNVYRAGKVVGKLGFAPGQRIGLLELTGYVGTDGAFGIVKQGVKAQADDLVGIE